MPQAVNIKQMSAVDAQAALHSVIYTATAMGAIPAGGHQLVIDAIDHPDDTVAQHAMSAIERTYDKGPFVSTLLKCAANHTNPSRAVMAYTAMAEANDLSPFYQEIDNGCGASNPRIAAAALYPLKAQAKKAAYIPAQCYAAVTKATNHADDYVAERAFSVLDYVPDKGPFVSTLICSAINHSNPHRAMRAFMAMAGASDLSPFYQAIDTGCTSSNPRIVWAALQPAKNQAAETACIAIQFHPLVISAAGHPENAVAERALSVVDRLNDKGPFLPALQKCAADQSRPTVQTYADEILKRTPSHGVTGTPAIQNANLVAAVQRDVRLNFNITANGVDPDAHAHDMNKALCVLFDSLAQKEIIRVRAAVFYDPKGKFSDNKILDIDVARGDINAILTASLQGVAPEFDLKENGFGAYSATLKSGPA